MSNYSLRFLLVIWATACSWVFITASSCVSKKLANGSVYRGIVHLSRVESCKYSFLHKFVDVFFAHPGAQERGKCLKGSHAKSDPPKVIHTTYELHSLITDLRRLQFWQFARQSSDAVDHSLPKSLVFLVGGVFHRQNGSKLVSFWVPVLGQLDLVHLMLDLHKKLFQEKKPVSCSLTPHTVTLGMR